MSPASIVIVGAGQAGASAATQLRRLGFDGRLVLIGDEALPPYERPPLSKEVLLQPDTARTAIFAAGYCEAQRIELRLGAAARALDPAARRLTLADGSTLAYDRLLLATGATARRLPLLDALGDAVHTLRTLDDAQRLRAALRPGCRVLLVGAGVIGLELASSAVELGASAVVIDPAPRPMMRSIPAPLAAFLQSAHAARGVDFRLGCGLAGAQRDADGVALTLDDGSVLRGELVVCGVGVAPDTALAAAAGLDVRREGVVVDAQCRTSDPAVYAAGDVACQLDGDGRVRRIESWENANQQAAIAAAAMLGAEAPQAVVPWFWTDQCGLNVQCAGDMGAATWVRRGACDTAPFLLFGLDDDGALVATIAVNQGREMRSARELIARRARIAPALLADPAQALRTLARAAPDEVAA